MVDGHHLLLTRAEDLAQPYDLDRCTTFTHDNTLPHPPRPLRDQTCRLPQADEDTFSTITFDEPPGCMLTPNKLSPASMVRFWWLTMSN